MSAATRPGARTDLPDGPEIWLVRHGETEWSRTRRHTGRSDIPLTEAGEAAARALGERLGAVDFDTVLASPLQRARHTAELAGFKPETEPLAMEWDYGDYEGITSAQIREMVPGWSIWAAPVPNGETLEQVATRARGVLERVQRESTGRALVVSHAHFSRILATVWIAQPLTVAAHLELGTTSVSVLGWDRAVPVIRHWNT